MTHADTESKRILSVLRDRPVSVDPAREEALRSRALPALERAVRDIASRRRGQRRLRWFAGVLAAIVTVSVVFFGMRMLRPENAAMQAGAIRAVDGRVTHLVAGRESVLLAGDSLALPAAGEVRTDGSSEATLETSRGLRMHLESGSRLALAGLSANGLDGSVRLEQGRVRCAVPKLHDGARFVVVSPNAKVVVHGTQFSVAVESVEAGVTRTCVRVTEGTVSVEQEGAPGAMLHAGDDWGCNARAPTAEERRPAKAAAVVLRVRGATPPRAQGTLAEETALLQAAIAAERQGRSGAASIAAARLVARYPDSPLVPEAKAVLDRVSQKTSEEGE